MPYAQFSYILKKDKKLKKSMMLRLRIYTLFDNKFM